MIAWALLLAAALPMRTVESGGVKVSWTVHEEKLELRLSSPGGGWLAVGFNDRPQLDGSRLIMARVRGADVQAEEHEADPPDHARVPGAPVSVLGGRQTAAGTEVHLEIPLAGRLTLERGRKIHLILAYSDSDDFQHHSRVRTQVTVTL